MVFLLATAASMSCGKPLPTRKQMPSAMKFLSELLGTNSGHCLQKKGDRSELLKAIPDQSLINDLSHTHPVDQKCKSSLVPDHSGSGECVEFFGWPHP